MEVIKSAMSNWQAFEMNRMAGKIGKNQKKISDDKPTVKQEEYKDEMREKKKKIYLDWPHTYMSQLQS